MTGLVFSVTGLVGVSLKSLEFNQVFACICFLPFNIIYSSYIKEQQTMSSRKRLNKGDKGPTLMRAWVDRMITDNNFTVYEQCLKPSKCYDSERKIQLEFEKYGAGWKATFGNQYHAYCKKTLQW